MDLRVCVRGTKVSRFHIVYGSDIDRDRESSESRGNYTESSVKLCVDLESIIANSESLA